MRKADALGSPADWALALTVATASGVFLGLLGPFGSYSSGSGPERIVYWTSLFWAGTLILAPAVRMATHAAPRVGVSLPFAVSVAVMVACVPMAAIAAVVGRYIWLRQVQHLGPADWYLETLLMAAPITVAMLWIERRRAVPTVSSAPSASTGEPSMEAKDAAFLDRLPSRLGRRLLYLKVEDHYVRAHTDLGSELMLIPLHQAILELGGVDGLHVHRSWWITRAAVIGNVSDRLNIRLRLTDGREAPVARNRVAELRAAGWLSTAEV